MYIVYICATKESTFVVGGIRKLDGDRMLMGWGMRFDRLYGLRCFFLFILNSGMSKFVYVSFVSIESSCDVYCQLATLQVVI